MAYPELVKPDREFTHKGGGYAVNKNTVISIQHPTTADTTRKTEVKLKFKLKKMVFEGKPEL